jgi:hypothetical protein
VGAKGFGGKPSSSVSGTTSDGDLGEGAVSGEDDDGVRSRASSRSRSEYESECESECGADRSDRTPRRETVLVSGDVVGWWIGDCSSRREGNTADLGMHRDDDDEAIETV